MNATSSDLRTIKNVLLLFAAIVLIMILKTLAGLLIPLAFALFIGILVSPIIEYLDKKRWPYTLSISLITVVTLGFLSLIGLIVVDTTSQIIGQKEKLLNQISDKLNELISQLEFIPGMQQLDSSGVINGLGELVSTDFLLSTSGTVASSVGTFTFNFILSAIYLVAILGSIVRYEKYIQYLEGDDPKGKERLMHSFLQVKTSIVSYMKVKFFTSLGTGIFFGGISALFQVDFALFWGFLAFLLNFIPTVGSIAGTIPPILLGLVQIDSSGTFLFFISLLIASQFVWGNIIEPFILGSSVSLNTVTVILGLVVWGYIWGVTGMLLSVPLIVMARVILSQIPDAEMIVKLMGRSDIKSI